MKNADYNGALNLISDAISNEYSHRNSVSGPSLSLNNWIIFFLAHVHPI